MSDTRRSGRAAMQFLRWVLALAGVLVAVASPGPAAAGVSVSSSPAAVTYGYDAAPAGTTPADNPSFVSPRAATGSVAVAAELLAAERLVPAGEGGAVSVDDLSTVRQYLNSQGWLDEPENSAMVDRIQAALDSGTPLTEGEQNFMTHELTEANLVDSGMSTEDAHEIASGTHPPYSNYAPRSFVPIHRSSTRPGATTGESGE